MSQKPHSYDSDWLLETKLAQFGAIARHILSSTDLNDEVRKALQLIEVSCQSHNITHIIREEEFDQAGLLDKLAVWERRGAHSESDYMNDRYREVSLGLLFKNPHEDETAE